MPQIATLKKWPPTALWPHEALSFNPWPADHLEALDDALSAGWTLTEGKVQQEAGEMWVDIVAEMSNGGRACIEAQFAKSNHDHLGKLLTYIAAYEAKAAIGSSASRVPNTSKRSRCSTRGSMNLISSWSVSK